MVGRPRGRSRAIGSENVAVDKAEVVKREQFFALGVALGTALGLALGSIIALRVGEEGVEAIRQLVGHLLGGDEEPKFEYLLQ